MNKPFKTIVVAAFSILFVIIAKPVGIYVYYLLKPKPKPWGVEYTDKVHHTLDSVFKTELTNDSQRAQVLGCVIGKLKKALPNGLETIPEDSLFKMSENYGYECGSRVENMEATMKWTPETETEFKNGMAKGLTDNRITPDLKIKLCDCAVVELKAMYPQELHTPLPKGLIDSILVNCAHRIKNSN